MHSFSSKKINKTFLFYSLLFFLIDHSNNYIIFPFKSTKISLDLDDYSHKKNPIDFLLPELNKNQLFTTISIGNPPNDLEFYFTMDNNLYGILSGYCRKGSLSSYNPNLSHNFHNLTNYVISVGPINNGAIATDNCTLYNELDLLRTKNIENFEFLVGNYVSSFNRDNNKYCGMLGLYQSSTNAYAYAKNFIKYLKEEEIINSYSWGIFFFDKDKSYNIENNIQNIYDGFYIAGITDEDYSNIFKTENIINANSIENNINFKIYFHESIHNKSEIKCSDNSLVHFIIDFNYIVGEKEYYNNIIKYFFQKYIDEKICEEKFSFRTYEGRTQMIICDLSFKKHVNSFPNLYLYSREFDFTFELDYNDIFLETNNKIYFLIISKDMINPVWQLGKIFMKKYPLIFDQDKKTISFVYLNKFKKREKNKKYNYRQKIKDYFLFSLLFIGILIGLFIGRRIWNKHRKLKANELEENFEYIGRNKIINNE